MTSSFPTTSSAPPNTVTATRTAANNQLNRTSGTNPNQQTPSNIRLTYDNRRYANNQTSYKRSSQPSISSNSKVVQKLSPIDVAPLPAARLTLQQQTSSPSRLQHQTSSSPQFLVSTGSILEPLVVGRSRPAALPPPNVRNAMHRNAVSLNTLSLNQPSKTTTRGRVQNPAVKAPLSTRTSRLRQQALAPFDHQQSTASYQSPTFVYRHPLNTDSPPVFFE